MSDELQDAREQGYLEGRKSIYRELLCDALAELGSDSPEWNASAWAIERAEVVACLRELCSEYGDNDWPDNLHLRDVIEKHIDWEWWKA